MAEVAELKTTIPTLEAEREASRRASSTRRSPQIPNLPLDDVPDGKDENGNVEHHQFGAKRELRVSRRSSISSWAKRSA